MDAIALPLLWTMKIKLIFLAEKLCLIAFITVNIKERGHSLSCVYCFLTFASAVLEAVCKNKKSPRIETRLTLKSNVFLLWSQCIAREMYSISGSDINCLPMGDACTHTLHSTHMALPNRYERRQTNKSRISGLLSADVCCSTLWLYGEIKTGSGN